MLRWPEGCQPGTGVGVVAVDRKVSPVDSSVTVEAVGLAGLIDWGEGLVEDVLDDPEGDGESVGESRWLGASMGTAPST